MKRFFFLLLISSLSTFHASSQTHFITAGQTQGMIFTDYVPDLSKSNLDIDLDRNSTSDFRLYTYSWSGLPGGGTSWDISSLNGGNILTKTDTNRCFSIGGSHCDSSLKIVTKKYSFGDTLMYSEDTSWKQTSEILYSEWFAGTSSGYSDYDVPRDSDYYHFVKFFVNTDTLLGYIHFARAGTIMDFACEGPTSSYIISSTNDIIASNISVSPNPFTNQINISIQKPFNYQITDYIGRVVLQGRAERTINSEELVAGNYLLIIKNEEIYSVKKITKIHP